MIKYILIFMTTINFNQEPNVIFKFDKTSNLDSWKVINDVVMGGKSLGKFFLSTDGNGVFEGDVSIENNGGFSSIRLNTNGIKTNSYKTISLRLKGDGSVFQFRIKGSKYERHSYIYNFQTTGDYETIEIPLQEMKPSYRGYRLDISNFNQEKIEQIGFLKASKKNIPFRLEIEHIYLN
jgi:hypothetical protein